ncbi:hypothetical protein L6654_08110 [Bradyrhizobium sp. WYCCWR 13023]|uniref:Uncharacterized protein n=1 Tax=Bradyrhizobium zhengyangense TaxID=2911009 RepID=A0A9X1R692_9BRAD|nr:hypothetical protein [Bradyrhizobium zhengyangense]MCG2626586.1 hypothetical protein [Bradyrhizobium zhengyangense]
MADSVNEAINKLLQFTTRIDRKQAVSFDDLGPVMAQIATALQDLDRRLKAKED